MDFMNIITPPQKTIHYPNGVTLHFGSREDYSSQEEWEAALEKAKRENPTDLSNLDLRNMTMVSYDPPYILNFGSKGDKTLSQEDLQMLKEKYGGKLDYPSFCGLLGELTVLGVIDGMIAHAEMSNAGWNQTPQRPQWMPQDFGWSENASIDEYLRYLTERSSAATNEYQGLIERRYHDPALVESLKTKASSYEKLRKLLRELYL